MLAISPTDRVFILTGAGVSARAVFRPFVALVVCGGITESRRSPPRTLGPAPPAGMRRRVASTAKPNPAHFALAKLENALQECLFVCTQNVDNLHEQAGSKNVVHMHGELFKSRCDWCSRPPFGPEEPANASSFTECHVGKAGEVLPKLFSPAEPHC